MTSSLFHVTPSAGEELRAHATWQPDCLGIDVVSIGRIRQSLADFGERFERRLFTSGERHDAGQDPLIKAERLAARFAAKEAALKAFSLAHVGVNWRELEVVRQTDGAPVLRVHGRAAAHLAQSGITQWALSLSHDGDHAVAIVAGHQDQSVSNPS